MADNDSGFEEGRRHFLKCMAWAGTGAVWTLAGGTLRGVPLGERTPPAALRFVQISDSHIGFDKAANADVTGTMRAAIARIKADPEPPAFILHTGDLTQLSKESEFETVQQVMAEASLPAFYVPGEHDMLVDDGRAYLERFGRNTRGAGWQSFEHGGVHFVGLVNVVNLQAGGLGSIGREQLEWLEKDVRHLTASTPIVVFAHIPLWSVYPEWGWGTDDSEQALSYLKRFGSVSVLNGHIHQVMQKVEGQVTFHTAMSTAFPQPAPGAAPSPGPMKVPDERLRRVLGLSRISFTDVTHPIAITDVPLAEDTAPGAARDVAIDNFNFSPSPVAVVAGTIVRWTNHDDEPHTITSADRRFKSAVLDTDGQFSRRFDERGRFDYFCSVHPHMTGAVIVT